MKHKILTLACIICLATATNMAVAAPSSYNVINAVNEDASLDFDDERMDVFYSKIANLKNFAGGKASIGYVDISKTSLPDAKKYKNHFVFFVVDDTKRVEIMPYIVIDKKSPDGKPATHIKKVNAHTWALCNSGKRTTIWQGKMSMDTETIKGESCVFYDASLNWNDRYVYAKWSGMPPETIKFFLSQQ